MTSCLMTYMTQWASLYEQFEKDGGRSLRRLFGF